MKRIITIKRPIYHQESIVEYEEHSTNENLIKKKELTIKSLGTLQLLLATMTVEQTQELKDIITVLETSYSDIEQILKISDKKDEFYEEYSN